MSRSLVYWIEKDCKSRESYNVIFRKFVAPIQTVGGFSHQGASPIPRPRPSFPAPCHLASAAHVCLWLYQSRDKISGYSWRLSWTDFRWCEQIFKAFVILLLQWHIHSELKNIKKNLVPWNKGHVVWSKLCESLLTLRATAGGARGGKARVDFIQTLLEQRRGQIELDWPGHGRWPHLPCPV